MEELNIEDQTEEQIQDEDTAGDTLSSIIEENVGASESEYDL